MERWCRDFDNWAIVDTACFALFDRKLADSADPAAKWVGRDALNELSGAPVSRRLAARRKT